MSINVTVNGNPVSIRRGRMVLSDLDQIKKNERDRRRKLRLEQVRQQSKEISNRLLERAKNVTKAQLTQLEKDGRSELRQMHDQKIMDLQRKYQEDMEDIGRAHVSASLQPDVEALLELDQRKNRFVAAERGKEARQRLKESNQVEDGHAALQERQRQVREMENARASMVANLPKKMCPKKTSEQDSDSTGDDDTVRKSPKKKKGRKSTKIQNTVPNVVVQSSDVQVIVSNPKARRSEAQPGPSRVQIQKPETSSRQSTAKNKTITDISHLPCVTTCCESDDQEPRKRFPTLNSPSKADKVASYNPRDYKPDSTSSTSSSSSPTTLSDDSSYFSDGAIEQMVSKKTPRHTTSAASSKVQLYDHSTRQRNAYDKPVGVVERININGEPNAEELARAVIESENADGRLAKNRRRHAQNRGNDAMLRERVRRDYQNLLQNLDHLSREERKLKASQIHGPMIKDIHLNPIRRQELVAKRQKDMDHAFETIAHESSFGGMEDLQRPSERIVTIPPIDEAENVDNNASAVWQDPPFFEPLENQPVENGEKENEMSRDEQIFEMLRKVERQKRLLLKEFGADLPDNIFSASVKPLFSEDTPAHTVTPKTRAENSPVPEIKVINLSSCDEKDKSKAKNGKKRVSAPPKRIEIAVQTSILDEKGTGLDKSVQVELMNSKPNSSTSSSSKSTSVEVVKPVATENIGQVESNSGSSDSVEAGIVIDMKKKQVKVTPRKKRSSLRIHRRNSPRVISKPRSMPGGKVSTPVKKSSRSAPVSKQNTPRSNISGVQPIKITDKKVKIQLDGSGIKVKIDPPSNTQVPGDTSTESSKVTLKPATLRENMPVSKKQLQTRDTSDTSTSYTSPPPPAPALYRSNRNNSTSVLEILENSEIGSLRSKKRGISPVSSPGTPSPRTINLPTNTPHFRQINRVLEYFDSTISQSTDNTMTLSLPGRQSTPNEIPGYAPRKLDKSADICSCKSPQCKLTHSQIEDIQTYASKNYPEVLKKYQDLQSMCTDRIASLTDLIEKVRSEQRGMELSVGGHSDESTMFQIPGPAPMRGDLHSVRKLVDSIEAIHNQLAKTLNESQRIIAVERISKQTSISKSRSPTQPSVSTQPDERCRIPDSPIEDNTRQKAPRRGIPRIVSSERVNIPMSRFKMLPKPKTSVKVTVTESSSPPRNESTRQEEDVVERLSKEILEQSKALDNLVSDTWPDYEEYADSRPQQHISFVSPPRQKSPSPKKQQSTPPTTQECSESCEGTLDPSSTKSEKDADFIPLLAGIPKVQRMPTSISESHRARPPVTLIYGPHRVQTGSPGHELSTIVEFDTPDTASKSARSPTTGKSRKNLVQDYQSSVGKPQSPSIAQKRSPIRGPSPSVQTSPRKSPTKKFSPQIHDASALTSPESKNKCEATCPKSPKKNVEMSGTQTENFVSRKDTESESTSSIPDISTELHKRNLIFHARRATMETETPFRQRESRKTTTSASTEADRDKITSTSSNSFSGLSGISEITSTPTSDILKYTSSPEEMEAALKKLGLGWAITTLKKTREASALSSSSNSDTTPINPSRKMITPVQKDLEPKMTRFPNLSDVSSISIKDANKSTERALLLKARTSTPNIENSNSSCEKPTSTTNSSRASLQDQSDTLTAPNLSLTTKTTSNDKQFNGS